LYGGYIGPNLFHRVVELRQRPSGDKNVSALFNKAFCRSQADATVTAGDQCNFTFQFFA
jgi:hypothetical protein